MDRSRQRRQQGAVPDFIANTESPDQHRQKKQAPNDPAGKSLWRSECVAKSRRTNLRYVEDMRILHVSKTARHREGGHAVIVATGAHVKGGGTLDMQDLLLYAVKTMDGTVTRPYSFVYYHTDTLLPAFLDVGWFLQLHAALDPLHKDNLQHVYVVHPSPRLRMWHVLLKMAEPAIYKKVIFVSSLAELCQEIPSLDMEEDVPLHVREHNRLR